MLATLHDYHVAIPQLPPKYVSRPRLLARLDQAAEFPLTLLCAGPGAGKTALLADWARRVKARAVWLSPAAADAETDRLWRLLEAAVPDGDGTAHAPRAGTVPFPAFPAQELAPTLFNRAAQRRTPLVVIVDDAHLLSSPGIRDSLDSLIRSPQPWLRLVLAARSDPPLPLHKYRLDGQLLELRAPELAMTPVETREVLTAHGVSLSDADFGLLAARTEGWAAGVRLSAMRMEGVKAPGGLVSQLAMDPGSIGEYLIDEVVRRLSGPQRQLLIETSFLDEVTGPLADAVTGMTGCGDMLADLARGNSFVLPLDSLQTRYRCHHLFGETLRYLLRRRDGQSVRQLRQRAADWFEANGELGTAVYWAVQADNGKQAAALLAGGGLGHVFVHRIDLSGAGLQMLLPSVPPEDAATVGAVITAICASPESAAGDLERFRAGTADQASADPGLEAARDMAELILGQKACDADVIDAAARRLLSGEVNRGSPPALAGLRAAVMLAQASAHLWHGRHDDVGSLLDAALAAAQRDGLAHLELEVLAMMSFNDSFRSRTGHADQAAKQAEAIRRGTALDTPPALELATALRAVIAGDLGGQAQALRRVVLSEAVGTDPGLATVLALGQASLLLADGRPAEARAMLLKQAERRIPPVLAVYRDIMIADLDAAAGRPRPALALLDGYQGTEFAVLTAVARARAHLALGDRRRARNCVRSVLTAPSAQVGRLDLVAALLCDARIAQDDDEPGRALEVLGRAIEISRGEIVLPFLRAGDAFARLLARHPDVAGQWPTTLPAASSTPMVPAQRMPRDLADPLTPRELTILRLLATNMSTVEIADELCLSVNTIKTHLAAIYRKLSASRRREAVLQARELELI